jgi:hypothetical protein
MDALNNIDHDMVRLELQDGNSSALITVPEQPGFKYVVMPMRIERPARLVPCGGARAAPTTGREAFFEAAAQTVRLRHGRPPTRRAGFQEVNCND